MTHVPDAARRALLRAGGGAALATVAGATRAQEYPAKPVRVIVPFAAGGGGDILARLMLSRVGRELGQPMVFENVAGAGGNIGAQNATRAAPDGYTLLYGTNGTHAINHTLYPNAGFDPVKDFEPVAPLSRIAAIVVVRPGLQVGSMRELLAALKAAPGRYTFASAGNGTTSHLAGEILKSRAGVSMVHIPYRGGAPAMVDLIAGNVDLMIEVMPNAVPQVKAGRVRALAVTTKARSAAVPDVPTIDESGVPGFDVSAWDALFAPARTPAPIVARLNEATRRALADPELQAALVSRGAEAAPGSSEDLRRFVASEVERWGQAVKRSGAKVD
jgi:tripartite-type tricarboxylate transporter receptor subunit TctC